MKKNLYVFLFDFFPTSISFWPLSLHSIVLQVFFERETELHLIHGQKFKLNQHFALNPALCRHFFEVESNQSWNRTMQIMCEKQWNECQIHVYCQRHQRIFPKNILNRALFSFAISLERYYTLTAFIHNPYYNSLLHRVTNGLVYLHIWFLCSYIYGVFVCIDEQCFIKLNHFLAHTHTDTQSQCTIFRFTTFCITLAVRT